MNEIDWKDIKSKARMYKTAKLQSTGEYVALCGVIMHAEILETLHELDVPVFRIRPIGATDTKLVEGDLLTDFCL